MIAIGRAQLEKWMSVPTGTVHPVDVTYTPRHNGYDLWGFIQAVSETARHLMSVTRSPAARWLNVFRAERRRIPMVSDLKVAKVDLNLMPPIACIAILQTMFYEAGYEFFNQVPSWPSLREVSGVPDEVIRAHITCIVRYLTAELASWNSAVGATPCHVRQPSDPFLTATAATSGTEVSFPVSGDGPTDMDVDTQVFLGQEVVVRLQNTGLRPRSPTSSVEGEPIRKRALLTRSSAGNSTPSYYSSSVPSEDVPMRDPVPSLVGQSGSSDTSMMVTDEGTNLSGFSSSGSSMLSSTDYMAGSGTHMSMPGATVMMGSVAASARSGFP
jgi:hypothetical protein